jgi:hypothetical protein
MIEVSGAPEVTGESHLISYSDNDHGYHNGKNLAPTR